MIAQLFNGVFAPVTFSCAFVRLELSSFSDAYFAHIKRNYSSASMDAGPQSFREALVEFQPLVSPMNRELLVSTSSGWTAIFGNGVGTNDCFNVASVCSRKFSIDAFAVVSAPDRADNIQGGAVSSYRSMQMQYFTRGSNEPRRTIVAANDGGRWIFVNQGDPFGFENAGNFLSKRVRDRFRPEDVETACRSFGLSISSESAYGPGNVSITCASPLANARVLDYEQARAQLGIVLVD